ncbi:MAG: CPBP family intramembrane metalloprotease [Phenylobacterium sp.]|uniref:CPBP family intramembrane glutamic endopeptidase n=1 Tax=Phenylobacterium sp. TaxID=1871053 RepID=UPI0012249B7A|nr:CPBP family intramembrane glutamic endopeptidase [Phenylobacterium sp.]TAJ71949.1 MAG: CPBP family intramembrane metalloprotease [Phenylobacterium sp.]
MADDPAERLAFPFLDKAGPAERGLVRVCVTVALGAAAGLLAALSAATLLHLIAAGLWSATTGAGFLASINLLTEADRPDRSLLSYTYELAMVGGASISAAGAFIAVAARRAGRPMRTFLTVAPRFRWRQALAGLLIFLPVVAAEIWLDGVVHPPTDPAPVATPGASVGDRLIYVAAAAGFLWLAALAEEVLFRGWLLQQARAFTRSVAVIVAINAVAFSLAHGDPSVGGLVTRLALGIGWAWIVLRLDGVEFAAGAHLANNLGLALLAKPVLLTQSAPQPFEPLSVALQVGTVAALAWGVEWWVRRGSAAQVLAYRG